MERIKNMQSECCGKLFFVDCHCEEITGFSFVVLCKITEL